MGKKIASCLAAVSCQHTLDHLMYEISQLLHETDDPSVTKAFAESANRVRPSASSSTFYVQLSHKEPYISECAEVSSGE